MANKFKESGLQNLPACAAEYIKLVIKKMRYRKKVRLDVQAELAAHFEDELQDCKTDEEKEQRAKRLIEDFGDVKLLAVLLRRAKKRCRPLWRTVVARTFQTIGVLILCFIVYCIYISLGKPTINVNYVEEATRLAQPVTDESLNAAPIYQKAIDAYKEPPLVKDKTGTNEISLLDAIKGKDWITELTEEELALLKQWLSDNTDAIGFFKQASGKPHCWWKRDAKDKFIMNVLMPDLKPSRNLTKLIIWQAKLKAYDGHIEEAFDDLLACYRAGRHYKGPHPLIEQLVGIGIQALSVQNILIILNNQEVDSQLLKDLQIRLEELMAEDTYTISYDVERFLAMDFLQRCYTNNGKGSGHMIPSQAQKFIGIVNDSGQSYGETEEKLRFGLFMAMSITTANRRDITRAFDEVYDTAQKWAYKTPWQLHKENADLMMSFYNGSVLKQARYWPVFMFIPATKSLNKTGYRLSADVESTLTVVVLLRCRQDTGSYPESLDDLVAAGYLKNLPMDPFSDKPLVYKKTADGFTLYSVGFNFEDDGGQSGKDDKGQVKKWADNGDAIFWPVQK